MTKILVTGFEPFGGDEENPSQILLSELDTMEIVKGKVFGALLPVEADKAITIVKSKLLDLQPDVVILLGVAKGRSAITPERVAINIKDYPIADNSGNQPIDLVISRSGESAYFSTLPIKSITTNLNDAQITAAVSNTAGTYVCNHLFYHVAKLLKETNTRYGFIHLPFHLSIKENPDIAFMPIKKQIKGIEIAIQTCLEITEGQHLALGAIC